MTSHLRLIVLWFLAGLLGFPVTTLLHEVAGHYAVARMIGSQPLAIHYASVDLPPDAVLEPGYPAWKMAMANIAGPAVSLLIIFICAMLVKRETLRPFAAAFGIAAVLRFFLSGFISLVMIMRILLGMHSPFHPGMDEYSFAGHAGLPPLLVLPVSFLLAMAAIAILLKNIWGRVSITAAIGMCTGVALGAVLYERVIGPAILP